MHDFGDLRPSSARRLDLRSASDDRDTNAAFAAHENACFAGFTKYCAGEAPYELGKREQGRGNRDEGIAVSDS